MVRHERATPEFGRTGNTAADSGGAAILSLFLICFAVPWTAFRLSLTELPDDTGLLAAVSIRTQRRRCVRRQRHRDGRLQPGRSRSAVSPPAVLRGWSKARP